MVELNEIRELADRIAREFDPERIILFGSHAYGTPGKDSDVDLMVVLSFEGSGFRQAVSILNCVRPDFPIDLIAKRAQDVERRYNEYDPLIRDVVDNGTVLYERNS